MKKNIISKYNLLKITIIFFLILTVINILFTQIFYNISGKGLFFLDLFLRILIGIAFAYLYFYIIKYIHNKEIKILMNNLFTDKKGEILIDDEFIKKDFDSLKLKYQLNQTNLEEKKMECEKNYLFVREIKLIIDEFIERTNSIIEKVKKSNTKEIKNNILIQTEFNENIEKFEILKKLIFEIIQKLGGKNCIEDYKEVIEKFKININQIKEKHANIIDTIYILKENYNRLKKISINAEDIAINASLEVGRISEGSDSLNIICEDFQMTVNKIKDIVSVYERDIKKIEKIDLELNENYLESEIKLLDIFTKIQELNDFYKNRTLTLKTLEMQVKDILAYYEELLNGLLIKIKMLNIKEEPYMEKIVYEIQNINNIIKKSKSIGGKKCLNNVKGIN